MGTLRRRKGREVWTARYVDADGISREVSTGCKDRGAARQVLAGLEARTEKIASGIISKAEANTATWAGVPLAEHIEAHAANMQGLRRAASTVGHRRWFLTGVVNGLGWKRLADLSRPQLERWLNEQVREGMGARNRNAHASAMVSFGNWLVRAGRLSVNPFAGLPMLNEKADRRRERRVLSMDEFAQLIDAAERRPLAEASKNRGSDANLTPATVDKLLWLGETRSMIYSTLMFTGLRYGELRSITIGQVHLEETPPYIELRAANEKARRGAQIPLPASFAAMLARHIAVRTERLLKQRGASMAFPGVLNAEPLFAMPGKMTKVFNEDLAFAKLATVDKDTGKILKRDAQGRTLDVHALRHSFCTLVAQSGVNMQTAQRLMRHATPAMTARYTHLTLTDLSGAIAALPGLPEITQPTVAIAAETGANLRPILRPINGRISMGHRAISCTLESQDKGGAHTHERPENIGVCGEKRMVGDNGLEPSTPCMSSKCLLRITH